MKKIIFTGSVVIIFIILILVIGISNIGPLIKKAVNSYGPGITKTELHVEDVSVSIFSGEARLKEFYMGNPRGFKSPEAMRVGSVFVDVEEKSLIEDTIIIDRIEVVRPEITYEKVEGTDNFKTIIDNIKKSAGAGKASKDRSEEAGKGKKILIRDFIVKDGKVTLASSLLAGKSISAPLPDIHLKNLGGEKEGASPDEMFKEILTAVYEKITSNAVTDFLNKELKTLEMSLEEAGEGAKKQLKAVEEDAKEELEKVSEKLKGLLDEAALRQKKHRN